MEQEEEEAVEEEGSQQATQQQEQEEFQPLKAKAATVSQTTIMTPRVQGLGSEPTNHLRRRRRRRRKRGAKWQESAGSRTQVNPAGVSHTHTDTQMNSLSVSTPGQEMAQQQQLQYQSLQAEALFHYSVTGDSSFLLAPQRPLLTAQDEDGDTSVTQSHH